MAETHKAKLMRDRGHRRPTVEVIDPEPLPSARLFKAVSDVVWDKKTRRDDWASFGYPSVLDPEQALTDMNEVLEDIDKRLVRIRAGKSLRLGGMRGERITIKASDIRTPEYAGIETFNWDKRNDSRLIEIDREREVAQFTDGHRDYARELSVGFSFRPEGHTLSLSYLMQRYQYQQADPTNLSFHVWYSPFAETGYEGNSQFRKELTPEEEIRVLTVFASIGGITLDPSFISLSE